MTLDHIHLVDVDPLADARWSDLQDSGGSLFTSAPWIDAVARTYGLTPRARLVVDDTGAARAGLAYCEIDDVRGHRVVSFPFSDFHAPLGDDRGAVDLVVASFSDEAVPSRLTMPLERTPAGVAEMGFGVATNLLTHRITVNSEVDRDSRFASLHPNVRQNIRRSKRSGTRVELSDGRSELREFYELHTAVRARKYRLLPQPFGFFERLHDAFAGSGALTVALARHEGRAIAGIVYLEMGDWLYYKFNASDADHLSSRPNEQLVLAGIELCADRGLAGIDLGVSDVDQPGLVRYKRKLADNEQGVVTLTGGRRRPSATADEISRLLPRLTELFTDDGVGPDVAQRAGALLYRYFA